jgi:hypothetical protein
LRFKLPSWKKERTFQIAFRKSEILAGYVLDMTRFPACLLRSQNNGKKDDELQT